MRRLVVVGGFLVSVTASLGLLGADCARAGTTGSLDVFFNPAFQINGVSGGTLDFELDAGPIPQLGFQPPVGPIGFSVSSNDLSRSGFASNFGLDDALSGPSVGSHSYGDLTLPHTPSPTNNYYDQTTWSVTISSADFSGLPILLLIHTSGLGCPGGYCQDPTLTVTYSGDLSLTPVAAPTPLPAALPLFAGGLGVMGWIGRRRRRKAQLVTD
jgi:hypothetical protein